MFKSRIALTEEYHKKEEIDRKRKYKRELKEQK